MAEHVIMALTYFKRFRMERPLTGPLFRPDRALPPGYTLEPWRSSLLAAHAESKYHAFREEIDAHVFPCLADPDGCVRLMEEISRRQSFIPEATWLITFDPSAPGAVPVVPETITASGHRPRRGGRSEAEVHRDEGVTAVATIQGLESADRIGTIQNVGVSPAHRGRRLGEWLLASALAGFARAGMTRCQLEVTADNFGAIRLYERVGFTQVRTVYKAAMIDASRIEG